MLTVIFGAGASYDSTAEYPASEDSIDPHDDRPPLTNGLLDHFRFLESIQHYPQVGALITDVRGALENRQGDEKRSVERVLDEMQREAVEGHLDRRVRQLMAFRYYVHEAITRTTGRFYREVAGRTNHQTLVNRIQEWREVSQEPVCLVTFNYDTLIERACESVLAKTFDTIQDYAAGGPYLLLKLHGSVNWMQPVGIDRTHQPVWAQRSNLATRRGLIDHVGSYDIDDRNFVVVPDPSLKPDDRGDDPVGVDFAPFGNTIGTHLAIPAIAIPLEKKRSFVCPPSFPGLFQQCLRDTTRLLLIGWRGSEEHFLELWKGLVQPHVRVLVVTGSTASAQEVWARISGTVGIRGDAQPNYVGDGFTGLLQQNGRIVREFLGPA